MKNKVVIVTGTRPDLSVPHLRLTLDAGANSPLGIGRAASHLFAANGATVVYLCDYDPAHLETHKREINGLYPSCKIHVVEIDTTNEEQVERICNDAVSTYGRLDIMFANAGIVGASPFQHDDAENFMHVVRGNLLSAFLCAKHAALAMQKTASDKPYPGGSIVLTASTAGLRSNAGSSSYSAAKAGVISLAQTLSYQLSGKGIRANAICPGIIETGMTSIMYEAARARGTQGKIGQLNPLRRGGVADEVARLALFLGSDEASYVNGQAVAVDGGLSAGHPFVPGKLA